MRLSINKPAGYNILLKKFVFSKNLFRKCTLKAHRVDHGAFADWQRYDAYKDNKGFTLVEMVISVAFLAIISMLVLQLFITARNLSLKSSDLDKSVTISKKVIEIYKVCNKPEDILNDELIKKCVYKAAGSDISISLYYDENWRVIDKNDKNDKNDKVDKSDEAFKEAGVYLLSADIKASDTSLSSSSQKGIYQIRVKVFRNKPYMLEKEKGFEIYEVNTDKYFGLK